MLGNFSNAASGTSGLLFRCLSPQGEMLWEDKNATGAALDLVRASDRYYVWTYGYTPDYKTWFGCWQIGLEGGIIDYNYTEPYSYNFSRKYYFIDDSGNILIGDSYGSYNVTSYSPSGVKNFFYTLPDYPVTSNGANGLMTNITQDKAGNYYCGGGYGAGEATGAVNRMTKLSPQGDSIWAYAHHFNDSKPSVHVKSAWINDSILVTVGTHTRSVGENKYYYYLMFYDKKKFIYAYEHQVEGINFSPDILETKDSSIFIVGSSSLHSGYLGAGRFLHKYTLNLSQLSNVTILDQKASFPLMVVPNPGIGTPSLLLPWEAAATNGVLSVFTLAGRCVSTETHKVEPGENVLPLHTAALLPAGQYYIRLQVAGRYYAAQWLKI